MNSSLSPKIILTKGTHCRNYIHMNIFRWDNEKNELLKNNRGVCFEQVVMLMERGEVLDTIEHPNQERYPGQKIAVVMIDALRISCSLC